MVTPVRSLREQNRRLLRGSLIAAARNLAITRGWDAVRMADVAEAAGVSRQTVYNEFANKAGLGQAVATEEIERFVAAVRTDLATPGDDMRTIAEATIRHVLVAAAENPLVKAILTGARGGADDLLPYLTTRADVVLVLAGDAVREWAAAQLDADATDLAPAAESIVRLVVSHVVLPSAAPETAAATLADVVMRLLPFPPRPGGAEN
ncbi:TetR family transcriptional regulator [Krasilnikovia sp. MM14-A1004]|uniref:TetR family transcriptional regulator n=1 Tax=Krasilnikovia sp. MM14-A1004 TaxID=3373541 RepID=UPI00399CB52A